MAHIALVGPMGVGKTTVGRALSTSLDTLFVDLDELIEKTANKSIPSIFELYGEERFRTLEFQALQKLGLQESTNQFVVATGGGIVVTPKCRDVLKQHFTVVYLQAPVETLVRHLQDDATERPLLRNHDSLIERVRALVQIRTPLYEEVADVSISVQHRSPDDVVKLIVDWLK